MSNLGSQKAQLWHSYVNRENCRTKNGRERRKQHTNLAHRMLAAQKVSHTSVRFIDNNTDNDDTRMNHDAKNDANHKPKHQHWGFGEINIFKEEEQTQRTDLANRVFAAQEISCVLSYFTNNMDGNSAGLNYNMRNNVIDKPKYQSYSFSDANAYRNELSCANFAFVYVFGSLGNSSDRWQPCSSGPFSEYKRASG